MTIADQPSCFSHMRGWTVVPTEPEDEQNVFLAHAGMDHENAARDSAR